MDLLGFLEPVEVVVSYIFVGIHNILTLVGVPKGPGLGWILSIVLLTVTIRICILPLFIKQVHSMRKMQALQPRMKAIQKKYEGKKDQVSREMMSKETMALYKEEGANPMASCLPILIQSPFFLALFRTLSSLKPISEGTKGAVGAITQEVTQEIEKTSYFGISLSDTFQTVPQNSLGYFVIGGMIACMCVSMFVSQRLVMQKNMPIAAKEGPQYQSQKMMVYIFPVMYIFSGVVFPCGVLLYWLTTNIWTLGQGVWQLEFMPTPGSEAALKREAKQKAKKEAELQKLKEEHPEEYEEIMQPDAKKQQRQQPKRKKKKG